MRVLRRFTKPSGHWAEIRERKVTQFHALEFLVFVEELMLESQMFHDGREAEYPSELEARIRQFANGGWIEEREGTCPHCLDGWVCEEHPDLPQSHDGCGGAGNAMSEVPVVSRQAAPSGRLDLVRVYLEISERIAQFVDGGWPHALPHRAAVGPRQARQSTVVTERDTIEAAFAEIDRMAAQMVKTGCPSDAIELIVVDENGRIVRRPNVS